MLLDKISYEATLLCQIEAEISTITEKFLKTQQLL